MASKPTVRERLKDAVCPNCGGKPVRRSPKGPPPIFCSKECKRAHNNRLLVEGRAVIGFLKAWRIDRGSGEIAQKSLAQVCEIVDHFNAKDLKAKRPRADLYAATLLGVQGVGSYFDRQRPTKNGGAK